MRPMIFVSIVLAFCVAGYAAVMAIGSSSAYCRHSIAFLDAVPCYQSEATGQSAPVLLAGDSSLLYGVSPRLVAEAGGGDTYNLGTVGPGFGFGPEIMIDRYLAHNAKPLAIILYFSPWNRISRTRISDPRWAQFGIFLLQHGSLGEIARFLRALPSAIVELPPIIVGSLGLAQGPVPAVAAQMAADRGHLDYGAWMPRALGPDCHGSGRPAAMLRDIDNRAALAALRRRYESQGIAVFVHVAPVATCDDAIGAVRAAYRGAVDNEPQALPDPLFADDAKDLGHVHPSPAGSAIFSANLAAFIRTRVQPRIATEPPR
jgi:hypothetical protein